MSQSPHKGGTIAQLDDYRPLSNGSQTSPLISSQRTNTFSSDEPLIMQQSSWVKELLPRFEKLMALPVGWDGYSGSPVSFDCAHFAMSLIERLSTDGVEAPQAVPGSDGSLQLEWHSNGFDIELDILAPYEVNAMRREVATDKVEELELQANFTVVRDWIVSLQGQTGRSKMVA